ncbi:MSC_0775 family lipoprotein [Mycoplasma bradburyae]|uniref:MSC_0775 family lipoprotein n=1 Tax=Mycoplasma bradburyae TaxID=2963128 RepID=UPI0023412C92|nr:hypothetical protein [Mycoplasma bradburyae]MDC4184030.1 hypothetical protein [Mycoplasma bradburyae]
MSPSRKFKKLFKALRIGALAFIPITSIALNSCYNEETKVISTPVSSMDDNNPSDSQPVTPVNQKFGINLASFSKLDNATNLLKWKNPESKTSEMEIGNILKNKFLENNLEIKVDDIKNILMKDYKVDQRDLDKYSFSIKYNEVFYDRNDPDRLIVPIQLLKEVVINNKLTLYQGHVYKFVMEGFKHDKKYERFEGYKAKLQEFKTAHPIVSINIGETSIGDLLFASEAALKKLSIDFKDFEERGLYQKISDEEKISKANKYRSTKKAESVYSAFVKSVSISNDLKKLHFVVRLAYGFSSYQWSNDFNSYGEDISFDQDITKTLTADDYKKIALSYLDINLRDFSPVTNYDFVNFDAKDFYPFSKNKDLITFKINETSNVSIENKNAEFRLKTTSLVDQLNNLDLDTTYGVKKHVNIFADPEITDSNKTYNLHIGLLTQNQLSKITTDLYTYLNNTSVISGGYGEIRGFYAGKKTPAQLHLGEDVLVKAHSLLKAPVKSEVINVFERRTNKVGEGVGTSVILRIKSEDLKNAVDKNTYEDYFASSKYIYVEIIHLDAELTRQQLNNVLNKRGEVGRELTWTPKKDQKNWYLDISPEKPVKLEPNDTFAVVAESDNNGGWMPHAHIDLLRDSMLIADPNGYVYSNDTNHYFSERNMERINDPINKAFIQVPGVVYNFKSTSYNETDPNGNEITKEVDGKQSKVLVKGDEFINQNINIETYEARGLLDPSLLFAFKDENTYIARLRDFFKDSYPTELDLQD